MRATYTFSSFAGLAFGAVNVQTFGGALFVPVPLHSIRSRSRVSIQMGMATLSVTARPV